MPPFTRKPRPSIAGPEQNAAAGTSTKNIWEDLGDWFSSLSPISSAYAEEQSGPSIPRGFNSQEEYDAALKKEMEKREVFMSSPYVQHLLDIENPNRNPKVNDKGLYQMFPIFRKDGKVNYLDKWPGFTQGKPSEADEFYGGHRVKIGRFENRFKRLPNDWELYSIYHLGGNQLFDRLEEAKANPDKSIIDFHQEKDKTGKQRYVDPLGGALDNNDGVRYKLFALAYNDAFPGTFKDPYNLDRDQQNWIKVQSRINLPLVQQINPYTVENFKRFFIGIQGGDENTRTWDKANVPYLIRKRSISRQR